MNDLTSVIEDKWHAGIDAAGLKTLRDAATSINSLHFQTRRHVARAAVEIGQHLVIARELFKGDLQFGQWCAEQFPWAKRTSLYNMRTLAEQVGQQRITEKLLDQLTLSGIFELLPASQPVLNQITEEVEAGGKPTVAAIRLAKRDEKADPEATPPTPEAPGPASEATPEARETRPATPIATPSSVPTERRGDGPKPGFTYHQWQLIINRVFQQRLRYYYGHTLTLEIAYVIFGLDPNPCCYPSPFVIDTLYEKYKDGNLEPDELGFLDAALALIEGDRAGFHAN